MNCTMVGMLANWWSSAISVSRCSFNIILRNLFCIFCALFIWVLAATALIVTIYDDGFDAGEVNQDFEWPFEFAVLNNDGVNFNENRVCKIYPLLYG